MIEKYIEGPQLSTESIIINGKCYTIGFSDRNYEYLNKFSPYIIENGGDLPSALPSQIQDNKGNASDTVIGSDLSRPGGGLRS